jgi:hypothetical protein
MGSSGLYCAYPWPRAEEVVENNRVTGVADLKRQYELFKRRAVVDVMILESTMNDREVAVVDQTEERRVIRDLPGKSTTFGTEHVYGCR